MNSTIKAQVRVYAILAQEARVAAVFRRGPSKRVQLLLWRTDTDQFQEGQWFKGRIYERRCDLSPSGKLLIYFAANYKPPYFSWTALSKPPYLTALALWPKGDGWGGGGLFENGKQILLNHRELEMELAKGFNLPRHFQIKPLGESPGWGEDNPIMDMRLKRDGWQLIQEGNAIEHGLKASAWLEFKPAIVWSKSHTPSHGRYELEMHIQGLSERDGPWYLLEHLVKDKKDGSAITLGRADWADWCRSGDLLFAKEGKIFRLGFSHGVLNRLDSAKLLIDLSDHTVKEVAPPPDATDW